MKRIGTLLLLLSLGLFTVGCKDQPATPPAEGGGEAAAAGTEEGGSTETPAPEAGTPAGDEKTTE